MARQRYGFDEAEIARFEKEGRGRGQRAEYRPWLTIRDVPSRGRSHRLQGMTTGRAHHFLSDIECHLFYLLDWSDSVIDIREQFPLERAATQRIAETLGVKHPCDTATRTPLVMTTDFLVDVVTGGRMSPLARAVKPASDLDNPRTLEKLEIERRYWLERDTDLGLVTDRDLPEIPIRNIAWFHSSGMVDQLSQPYEGYLQEKADLVARELVGGRAGNLRQFCDEMDLRLGMDGGTALLLTRHLLSRKRIFCPMDRPIDDESPLHWFQPGYRDVAGVRR
ncbi:MAG: TnsA endonuclease N-terminal domain-containing protein [Aliidongia sp.]